MRIARPASIGAAAAGWRAQVALLRPAHWLKNGFVLVGLVFGHLWQAPAIVLAIGAMFVAFCLAASSIYAFNDAVDARFDRLHPKKKLRPVASGAIGRRAAFTSASVLAAIAMLLALAIGWRALATVGFYIAINIAYSLWLKRVAVVDVIVIAAGFAVRLLAGTWAVGIPPSFWLLGCGLVFTLFLGFGKRRAELADALSAGADAATARPSFNFYSLRVLDMALIVFGLATVVIFALYAVSPDTYRFHGTRALILTVPVVALAIGRYIYLVLNRRGGDDPAAVVLGDRLLIGCCAAWLLATVVLLS